MSFRNQRFAAVIWIVGLVVALSVSAEPADKATRLTLHARIDGSDEVMISADGARWSHRDYQWADQVTINGMPWNVKQDNFVNTGPGRFLPEGVDFSTARLVRQSGRTSFSMRTYPDRLELLFVDVENGAADNDIEIAFGPTDKRPLKTGPGIARLHPADKPTTTDVKIGDRTIALINQTDAAEAADVLKRLAARRPDYLAKVESLELLNYHNASEFKINKGSKLGTMAGAYSPEVASGTSKGLMLWGIYEKWDPAEYLVVYRVKAISNLAGEDTCMMEVIAREQLSFCSPAASAFVKGGWTEMPMGFVLPQQRRLEFRVFPREADIAVDRVYIFSVKGAGEGAALPPTVWPLAMPAGATLISARFGGGQKWADVTPRLNALVADGKNFRVNPGNLKADPTPGWVKQLQIAYAQNGKTYKKTIGEGKLFRTKQDDSAAVPPVAVKPTPIAIAPRPTGGTKPPEVPADPPPENPTPTEMPKDPTPAKPAAPEGEAPDNEGAKEIKPPQKIPPGKTIFDF